MSLIKVSDKHSNLRLRFEHPIVLNPEKKYKLGVTHLMFPFRQTIFIQDSWFDVCLPNTDEKYISKNSAFEKELQNVINVSYNRAIEELEKDKKTKSVKKLKSTPRTPVKFRIKKKRQKLLHNF